MAEPSQVAEPMPRDVWYWRYIGLWFVTFAPVMATRFFPNVNALGPILLSLLLCFIALVITVATTIMSVLKRQWRYFLSSLFSPVPAAIVAFIIWSSPVAIFPYFFLHKNEYLQDIKIKPLDEHGEIRFYVGEFGIAISGLDFYIVYDRFARDGDDIGRINHGTAQYIDQNFYYLSVEAGND